MSEIAAMKILVIAATDLEIESFKARTAGNATRNNKIEYLITGVGAVPTTYSLTRRLRANQPDFIIAAGIGGSFARDIPLGSVIEVRSEVFADLGVQESRGWTDLFDLGLAERNDPPYTNGRLENPNPIMKIFSFDGGGCTVNQVTTEPSRIETIQKLYAPMVESMEGAAIHYVCIQTGIPFIHLRAISNLAGERDKQRWKMQEAIQNLGTAIDETIQRLVSQP